MPRGGYRENAGGKPTWISGKTKTIRVPIVLADRVIELARKLDEGRRIDDVTKSKYVDLSGIAIRDCNGRDAVYVEDLLRAGYTVRPVRLVDAVRRKMDLRR